MHLNFKHTKNTRDLGGIAIDLSHCIAYKKIVRSDVPINMTESEVQFLLKNKICTIIDLRDKSNIELSPTCLQVHSDFSWYNIPLQNKPCEINCEEDLIQTYMKFAGNFEAMRKIFKIISSTETGIFIHCQEGKDRTGVVCALLLLTAGVSFEDIIIDYQCTQVYMNSYIIEILNVFPEFPEYRYATKAEYMASFLKKFNEVYGDINEYLRTIGLSNMEIANIKSKLVGQLD